MNKVAFKNGEGDCRGDHKHGVVISEGLNYALKSYFQAIQIIIFTQSCTIADFLTFPDPKILHILSGLFCWHSNKDLNNFDMSSLTVSSKYVQIQANNMATVTIKNIKIDLSSPSSPILFKVKTNMKDLVDVRPSFGIVYSTPQQKSIVALSIKFAGAAEQLEKAKLMISWSSTEERKDLNGSKMSHEEFNKILITSKKTGEGSLILPFILKEVAERKRLEENRSERANSIEEQESVPEVDKEKEKEEEKSQTKPSYSKFQTVISERSEPQQKVVEEKGYSISVVRYVFILAFLLGLFVGTKIQTAIPSHTNVLQNQAQKSIYVKVVVASPQKKGGAAESDNFHQGTQQTSSSKFQANPASQQQIQAQKVEKVQIVQEVQQQDQVELDI